MYLFEPDTDPIAPPARDLLADLGLDVRSVRDALADERIHHCPVRDPAPARSGGMRGEG